MTHSQAYNICCQHHGKRVRITCKDGRVHVGHITRVDDRMVWIRPDHHGGYSWGWGWGWGGPGLGYGIALGTIAGVALAGAFLW